jgi:hypothetical protein
MNQDLDQRLRPFVNYYQDNWSDLLPIMDYAQLTLFHESIGTPPFNLLYGYTARTSFDWNRPREPASTRERLNRDETQAYTQKLHEAWETARAIMGKSQQKKERDVNRHCRPINFQVGDQVWVSTKNWKTQRPSHKLDHQMDGPYTILRQVGNSYKLGLSKSTRIHPVFAPELLHKDPNNPLPGQVNPPQEPIVIANDNEWEVQDILAVRKPDNGSITVQSGWYSTKILNGIQLRTSNIPRISCEICTLITPTSQDPLSNWIIWIHSWEEGLTTTKISTMIRKCQLG